MSARNVLVVAAALILASPAWAQNVNLARIDEQTPNHVQVRSGAEYGFVAGVGSAWSVVVLDRTFLLGGDATLPWGGFDAGDYSLRTSALIPIVGVDHWR